MTSIGKCYKLHEIFAQRKPFSKVMITKAVAVTSTNEYEAFRVFVNLSLASS